VYIAGHYRVKEIYAHSMEVIDEGEILKLKFVNAPVAMTIPEDIQGWQRIIVVEEAE
jgi:hypothetical protein